jgi:hypothetical protein
MKGFRLGQRVRVIRCGQDSQWTMPEGTVGTVRRLLIRDSSARIHLDHRLSGAIEAAHEFPPDDATRANSVLAWPDDCESV